MDRERRRSPTGYQVEPFTSAHRQQIDWLELMSRRHTIHALLEVDVTDARRSIREYRSRTGEPLSFTAFVVWCVARAVGSDRRIHAYREGSGRLVLFDDVDVTVLIERPVDGARAPVPYIIRAANRKDLGPGVVKDGAGGREERVEVREVLSLTLSMDHDVIDGAPAARFAARLKQLIEGGAGGDDDGGRGGR